MAKRGHGYQKPERPEGCFACTWCLTALDGRSTSPQISESDDALENLESSLERVQSFLERFDSQRHAADQLSQFVFAHRTQ